MTFIFRLGGLRPSQVSFSFSPAMETVHSLHVLMDSRSHPLHIPWVLRARRKLSPGLKAELERWRFYFERTPLPIFWHPWDRTDIPTLEEELASFRCAHPNLHGLHLLVKSGAADDPGAVGEPDQLLRQLAERSPEHLPLVQEYLEDPDRSKQRFADLLEGFWQCCLAEEWAQLEERFAADIEQRGRTLFRRGVTAALEELSPDMHADLATGSLIIRRPQEAEVVMGEGHRLYLVPSYFAWPHLYVVPSLPNAIVTYPVVEQVEEGRPPVPPDRLLKILRAAGDMTRLQILQLLAQRPRSTTELAGLIAISEASVSKHLKQLQEVGLVEAERQSYYVFYRLVREPLGEMAHGLQSLLSPEES